MNRCEICNYTPQDGSDLRDIGPSKMSVQWSKKFNGYLCWDCFECIQTSLIELESPEDEDTSTVPVRPVE